MRLPEPARAASGFGAGAPALRVWLLHLAFIATGIALYTGARVALSVPSPEEDAGIGASNPIYTLVQAVLLLGSVLHAALHPGPTLRRLLRLWPFLLLVALAMTSALWSQSPSGTFRRSLSFGTVVLFVAFADAVAGPAGLMRIVVRVMIGLGIGSLLEAALRPAIGFDVGEYANAVRGLFTQKNGLGQAMLGMMLALSFVVLDRGRITWRDLAVAGFTLVILVLSRSTTSLMLSLLLLGITLGLLCVPGGGAWLAGTFILAGLGATAGLVAFSALGPDAFFELIGKDSSLTGRVQIWEGVRAAIAQRPLLGYGFSAFWLPDTNAAETIWIAMFWQVASAHSGYLETLAQLGYVGAGLALAVALWTLARAVAALRDGRRRHALWALLFLVILAIYNYSEAALLEPNLFFVYWVLAGLFLTARPEAAPALPRPRPPGIVPFRREAA